MQKEELNRFPHICSLLKNIRWNFYNYIEEFPEFTASELKVRHLIDLCLDQILICNQHVTNSLTKIVREELTRNVSFNMIAFDPFYDKYPKGIFPHYLRNEGHELVKKYGDEIVEKFENISEIFIKRDITAEDFYDYLFAKEDLLDISKPYNDIILLQREIGKEIVRSDKIEYGYFLGCLLRKVFDDYKTKGYRVERPTVKGRAILLRRALGFRTQTEGSKERQFEVFDKLKPDEF